MTVDNIAFSYSRMYFLSTWMFLLAEEKIFHLRIDILIHLKNMHYFAKKNIKSIYENIEIIYFAFHGS